MKQEWLNLVLAPEQAIGWPSVALGSVHVDPIYQESTIIVFYLFSEKKEMVANMCYVHSQVQGACVHTKSTQISFSFIAPK